MGTKYGYCKICCSKTIKPWVVCSELLKCLKCGFIFASHIYSENEFQDAYDQLYSESGSYLPKLLVRENLSKGKSIRMGWRKRVVLNQLRNYPQRRVLELGASIGDIACHYKRMDIDYLGIEFNQKIAQYASSMGLNIVAGDYRIAEDLLERDSLDVIIAFEVLEHIQDIRPCLETLRKLLRPEGVLAFSIPNLDVYKNSKPPKLNQVAPPVHLNFWNRDSLKKTLTIMGFSPVYIQEHRIPVRTGDHWRDIRSIVKSVWKSQHGPTLVCLAQKE